MRSLGSMHEARSNAQTLHGSHCLPAHKSALAYTTDDDFAPGSLRLHHAVYGAYEALARIGIGLVEARDEREGLGLDRKHPCSAREEGHVRGVLDNGWWCRQDAALAFARPW